MALACSVKRFVEVIEMRIDDVAKFVDLLESVLTTGEYGGQTQDVAGFIQEGRFDGDGVAERADRKDAATSDRAIQAFEGDAFCLLGGHGWVWGGDGSNGCVADVGLFGVLDLPNTDLTGTAQGFSGLGRCGGCSGCFSFR